MHFAFSAEKSTPRLAVTGPNRFTMFFILTAWAIISTPIKEVGGSSLAAAA